MIIPVILSGGYGARLWPLSRELYPKQFFSVYFDDGKRSLFQDTVQRIAAMPECEPPLILCNEQHRFYVTEQLAELDKTDHRIMLEPAARSTAPALAAACFECLKQGDDPIIIAMPADHIIRDCTAYHSAIKTAMNYAKQDDFVMFGVTPISPETEFGYIKKSAKAGSDEVFLIDQFIEKPDLKAAKQMLKSQQYFWNSGIYMFKASRYLLELKRLAPEMFAQIRSAFEKAEVQNNIIVLEKQAYQQCENNSIEYKILEHTKNGMLLPVDMDWHDLDSFTALWKVGRGDSTGNVKRGEVITRNTKNCYLRADDRLMVTLGVEDLVVVDTSDALLITKRDNEGELKEIVKQLKNTNSHLVNVHRKVYRPWGSYENLHVSERFQVKILTVNPGAILSLQLHHHRSEHWTVVKGRAEVTLDDKVFLLSENESTYIPLGTRHRLHNPGKIPLEVIEVQTGSYLGEDDIVRFDDQYGRAK